MANYDSNYEIAQEISARIGASPVPFDSVYSIALNIYQELGGEGSEFDSVYSILLEILDEVAESPNIIHNVSELPDAYENKNKIVRLQPSDNLYQSVLVSSEETNKLPDEQQIDKAYLYYDEEEDDDKIYYYKGAYKIVCPDGEIDGFGWLTETDSDGFWRFELTLDNAENISSGSSATYYSNEDYEGELDNVNNIITTEVTKSEFEFYPLPEPMYIIPAIYNAPESAQIGNATLISVDLEHGVYNGEQITFEDVDAEEQITGYKWEDTDDSDYCFATDKPASQIYYAKIDDGEGGYYIYTDAKVWYVDLRDNTAEQRGINNIEDGLYIPQLNAPDSEQVGNATISVVVPHLIDGSATYSAEEVTIEYQSEEISGYEWPSDDGDGFFLTTEKAEDIYNKTDCDIYMVQGGSVTKIESMLLNYLTLTTEKKVRVNEVWDWKLLHVDNKLGMYKIYIDEQVCDDRGYDAYEIILEIVSRQLNDRLKELIHKILEAEGSGINLVMNNLYHQDAGLHYLGWDLSDIHPQLTDADYELIMNDMATAQKDNYDEGNWLYVAGIQFMPIFTVMPDLVSLGEDINELQTYLAFPLNTDDKIVLLND